MRRVTVVTGGLEDESGELAQDMTGNRIIDTELLNQNILSQVVCAFCQGYTQNANESINNLIWKCFPKAKKPWSQYSE